MIKSGKTSIDPMAVKDLSKDELYAIVKGKIDEDFDALWVKICKVNGNNPKGNKVESISKPSKQGKKS